MVTNATPSAMRSLRPYVPFGETPDALAIPHQ